MTHPVDIEAKENEAPARAVVVGMLVLLAFIWGTAGLWAYNNKYLGQLDAPCNGDATCDHDNLVCVAVSIGNHRCVLKSETAKAVK